MSRVVRCFVREGGGGMEGVEGGVRGVEGYLIPWCAGVAHCILCARDLRTLAFVFGLYRWSDNFWRLLVVYYRIGQIFRLNSSRRRGTGGVNASNPSDSIRGARPEGPAALDPAEPARLCAVAAGSYRTRRAPRGPGPLGGGSGDPRAQACYRRRLRWPGAG
jgi:hypothetical protein